MSDVKVELSVVLLANNNDLAGSECAHFVPGECVSFVVDSPRRSASRDHNILTI